MVSRVVKNIFKFTEYPVTSNRQKVNSVLGGLYREFSTLIRKYDFVYVCNGAQNPDAIKFVVQEIFSIKSCYLYTRLHKATLQNNEFLITYTAKI